MPSSVTSSHALQASGQYCVHYRNALHAFWTIARNDGLMALQSGLVPALYYQFFMNGVRLGMYQVSLTDVHRLDLFILLFRLQLICYREWAGLYLDDVRWCHKIAHPLFFFFCFIFGLRVHIICSVFSTM